MRKGPERLMLKLEIDASLDEQEQLMLMGAVGLPKARSTVVSIRSAGG